MTQGPVRPADQRNLALHLGAIVAAETVALYESRFASDPLKYMGQGGLDRRRTSA